ncbi:RHS repeat-associated core domain protein [Leptospira interrogans serovar Zanoni str. LT2156]|uniref:RHS repeat-associated core domain protein n=1 Tax=Leptospira interrogans serovar Zanoni str. LT2156 TaxID=1001601 RepID=M6I423_LEPIR|nr:RHS repeat-associated core domain protein [Leptospira interrogans serovar Zanoni str. LT2156]
MGANVAPGVPSIQNPGVGMTGGGSVGGMPVTGMYFYHPNHLGSIQMITDGAGNPASGPEPGVSYVSYEPYGSIIRNDSYGPDIFRYKFTGQIEDKETGLYYYKSRFYEPTLGRFLQADSVIAPDSVNGMNRYMYVDGNPVSYRDPSGHISGPDMMHMLNRIVGHAMGKDFNSKGLDKKLSTRGFSTGVNRFARRAFSLPGKVGTKEAWKQATIAGLQTNWDLIAMAQGYSYGHQAAKEHRFNANKVLSGTLKIIGGAAGSIVAGLTEQYWALSATVALIADGGDEYNEGLHGKSEEEKTLICKAESSNTSNSFTLHTPICYYGTVKPSSE